MSRCDELFDTCESSFNVDDIEKPELDALASSMYDGIHLATRYLKNSRIPDRAKLSKIKKIIADLDKILGIKL